MIRFLKGQVLSKDDRSITLLVHQVGYQVFLPGRVLETLTVNEDERSFHIHTQVREDALQLYGFENAQELRLFELLLNVNGVGPRLALQVLNEPSEKVVSALMQEDLPYFCRIPGLGKKTGERILLELKNKVLDFEMAETSAPLRAVRGIHPDVLEALESLGYNRRHIEKVLIAIPTEVEDPEHLIREFLQRV